jgi:hypothetical protein
MSRATDNLATAVQRETSVVCSVTALISGRIGRNYLNTANEWRLVPARLSAPPPGRLTSTKLLINSIVETCCITQ